MEFEGRLVKFIAGFGLPPKGSSIEKSSDLTSNEIDTAIFDLGKFLAQNIHPKEGQGFGPVDSKELFFRKDFKGNYKSWFEYLMKRFEAQTNELLEIRKMETDLLGSYSARLSPEKRDRFENLCSVSSITEVRTLLSDSKVILRDIQPNLIQGNLHLGNIYVSKGRFSGIEDFKQMNLGDSVDDLAYFSIMPGGEDLLPKLRLGWEEARGLGDVKAINERLHLYRLLQSYRKISTRYRKDDKPRHGNLNDHPEPLYIAAQEMKYFGI